MCDEQLSRRIILTSSVLHIKDTILLEDRTKHGLDDDAGAWVGDVGRLFVQLLGEEVNTQVSVLASRGGGGDADDLARAALKDQQIADADVMGRDGNSVGWVGREDGTRCSIGTAAVNFNINLLPIMVVVTGSSNDALSCTVESMSERVIVTFKN